jgi:hypothetical protein
MEAPTQPLHPKIVTQTTDDEPTLGTSLWVITGFIVFAAVIFALVISNPW